MGEPPPHPRVRMRRLRRTPALRALIRETEDPVHRLVLPAFVRGDPSAPSEIQALPGVRRLTVDELEAKAGEWADLGLPGVILFGIPREKDDEGRSAWDPRGVVPRGIEAMKREAPDLVAIADVCLCQYTVHGHCGIVHGGTVDNDRTLPALARAAVAYADAGADIVAPSAMMDGQVAALRRGLDDAGHRDVAILAYAAKYASAFYGPFREAAGSAPRSGDRRGYQMDPPNVREALREIALDLEEGADIAMVKPALPYLDVLRAARERFDAPLAAYSVSGEYAMVKAAAERGWLDERAAVRELLTSIRRAGADLILTYFAEEVARWSRDGR
jgi:porphobilinogen synthase